jgi:hypothetical protein
MSRKASHTIDEHQALYMKRRHTAGHVSDTRLDKRIFVLQALDTLEETEFFVAFPIGLHFGHESEIYSLVVP